MWYGLAKSERNHLYSLPRSKGRPWPPSGTSCKVRFSETSVTPNCSITHIHPRSCRRRFPPAKIHTRTMHSPQIVHVICAEKSTIPTRQHPKFQTKTKCDPLKNLQLTTKTEESFYPQEGGQSSTIDICFF